MAVPRDEPNQPFEHLDIIYFSYLAGVYLFERVEIHVENTPDLHIVSSLI